MAKVQIKSEKLTPFGGFFSIVEQFDSMLSPIIDQTLGQRCRSIIGYQYSEIIRSLMSIYFCGGSCVEDVTSHLMRYLSYHPTLRTCSSDIILRAIKVVCVVSCPSGVVLDEHDSLCEQAIQCYMNSKCCVQLCGFTS